MENRRLVRIIKRAGVFRPGETFWTSANVAEGYVRQGFAEYADEPTAAVVEPRENAMRPRARGRRG